MPVSPRFADAPLAETVRLLHTIEPEMNAVHLELPDPEGWHLCSALIATPRLTRRWQDSLADYLAEVYGCAVQAAMVTAAACMLDAYAYTPGFLVGAAFHVARRVPRVAPENVAFRTHPTEHWVSGVALLDDRFWCLPDDVAAAHPSATAVADEIELAEVAREQVRDHADAFLATYDPDVRMARRAPLAAFADSLDAAPWIADGLAAPGTCRESSSLLLPGGTRQFSERSRLYTLVDDRGRTHLTRRRAFCCKSYMIEPDRSACMDCLRTTDGRRRQLATELPDASGPAAGPSPP